MCQHPCQDNCNRGEIEDAVNVRDLKRFVADYIHANPEQYPPAKPAAAKLDGKIAIVGGGPAGLTAASDLALLGYGVTLFEAQPRLGGMLRYGIPSYRLPDDVLDKEIQYILDLGVEAKTGTRVADPKSLLESGFNAVFAAPGAWISRKLGIAGEDAPGVWAGLDFLYQVNSGERPAIGPNVVVIGGGDVAMDAARCARRLAGREVGARGLSGEPRGNAGALLGGGRGPRRRSRLPQQPGANQDRERRRHLPRLHQRLR